MSEQTEPKSKLGYLVNDADEHSTPPVSTYLDYIDPDQRDMAVTGHR